MRDEYTSDPFTPGSAFYVYDSQPLRGESGKIQGTNLGPEYTSMWTYENILAVLSDIKHPMYTFVQLCVEQSIMAPEDATGKEAFIKMAHEATFKAKRGNKLAIESIYERTSTHPQRRAPIYDKSKPGQLCSSYDSSIEQLPRPEKVAEEHGEDLPFYIALVDHIVRRQVIHSCVSS